MSTTIGIDQKRIISANCITIRCGVHTQALKHVYLRIAGGESIKPGHSHNGKFDAHADNSRTTAYRDDLFRIKAQRLRHFFVAVAHSMLKWLWRPDARLLRTAVCIELHHHLNKTRMLFETHQTLIAPCIGQQIDLPRDWGRRGVSG